MYEINGKQIFGSTLQTTLGPDVQTVSCYLGRAFDVIHLEGHTVCIAYDACDLHLKLHLSKGTYYVDIPANMYT